jgi:hypothetical protein
VKRACAALQFRPLSILITGFDRSTATTPARIGPQLAAEWGVEPAAVVVALGP